VISHILDDMTIVPLVALLKAKIGKRFPKSAERACKAAYCTNPSGWLPRLKNAETRYAFVVFVDDSIVVNRNVLPPLLEGRYRSYVEEALKLRKRICGC
jgi:hypothetical protein